MANADLTGPITAKHAIIDHANFSLAVKAEKIRSSI
jgi:hypothetical protein